MKVLLRRNVPDLGHIGQVVDVKPGYARNYLIPQRLGVHPTEDNLKAIEAEKQAYLEQLAREHAELQAKATLVDGKEVTIPARTNEEGHLYGSIGPAQISAALAADGVFVDAEYIVLDEAIRQLDKYEVKAVFSDEISATIHVWVIRVHEEDDEDGGPADPDEGDQTDAPDETDPA